MQNIKTLITLILFSTIFMQSNQAFPWSQIDRTHKNQEKIHQTQNPSNLVNLEYHMGPVLSSPINLYIIWYGGEWSAAAQSTIRDFITSVSSPATHPSVAEWWRTVTLYSDQTGSNVSAAVALSGEFFDGGYSHGKSLTRLSVQSIIRNAITTSDARKLPLNYRNGLYLVLTSSDVEMQEFCRAICGFHYFTFPNISGATMPYAWVGYSGSQCPGMCAFPFARQSYSGGNHPPPAAVMGPPNGDIGVDGMISVIAHELAEVSSNPLVNAWYGGDDAAAPAEIADLCLGVYGIGGGGGFVGDVYRDKMGNGYNLNGVNGRKYLVQWVWDPVKNRCFGPNARD